MASPPILLYDLTYILIVAAIVTIVFKRLRQPVVLGYIVAGFIVGPNMEYTPTVIDQADIQTWADIGVVFLLFSLGLEFSFKKLLKMGLAPLITVAIIITCMMAIGFVVGNAFGWGRMDCLFLAGMLALCSSTTIIYKALVDLGLRQQHFSSRVMGVLILEDVLSVVMMVLLSTIALGNNPNGGVIVRSILKIVFFLILWFVVGMLLIPLFLRRIRDVITNETLLIIAIGLCGLMVILSTESGFSSALGAFVMGSILAETVESEKISKVVEPVKDLFGAIFFVSVGMLVNPTIIVEYAVPIIVLAVAIIIGLCVFGSLGFLLSGETLKTSMRCGFCMTQIGEFGFILASLGMSLGVTSPFLYPVIVAVSVITTFLTPYTISAATPCYRFIEKRLPDNIITILNDLTLSPSYSVKRWLDVIGNIFPHNLRPRDTNRKSSHYRQLYHKGHLLDRNIHITDIKIPDYSLWAGKTLKQLSLRSKYGVDICSILRGDQLINIPNGNTLLFPNDNLKIIGSDAELSAFVNALNSEVITVDQDANDKESHEIRLKKIEITDNSPLLGKRLCDSGVRDTFNCMVLGIEKGGKDLSKIAPDHMFVKGDIIWIAGERQNLHRIAP